MTELSDTTTRYDINGEGEQVGIEPGNIPGVRPDAIIGDFQLEDFIGSGAMGEVWLAHHKAMDRKVALKILSPEVNDTIFIEQFIEEVKTSAKLVHPNIVTAFHAGQDKEIHYLAMYYVDGEELAEKLRDGNTIPEEEALQIARRIAKALEYAWKEFKMLHLDIKPSNIMIDKNGSPKLMDMGISKTPASKNSHETGMVVGSPHYMSPEQAAGKKHLDFRSDIYSLGITLFHMLSGDVPFSASNPGQIISMQLNEKIPSVKTLNPHISDECEELLNKMLSKKSQRRQQSWQEVISDIDRVLDGEMPVPPGHYIPPPTTSTRKQIVVDTAIMNLRTKSRRKERLSIILAGEIMLIIMMLSGAYYFFKQKELKNESETGFFSQGYQDENYVVPENILPTRQLQIQMVKNTMSELTKASTQNKLKQFFADNYYIRAQTPRNFETLSKVSQMIKGGDLPPEALKQAESGLAEKALFDANCRLILLGEYFYQQLKIKYEFKYQYLYRRHIWKLADLEIIVSESVDISSVKNNVDRNKLDSNQ